jgi:DNA-binding PadR family transcriptional regulator
MDTTTTCGPFGWWTAEAFGPRRHHRQHRRPPWAGPWGPWVGGPWGPSQRGTRPRPRRGDVRLSVLSLLAEQPMHGYQIITELAARSGGVWQPSAGSIYPTLQQLQDEGLVSVSEQDGRRTYTLTDSGREEMERATAGRRAPWEELADEVDELAGRLRERAGQVVSAVMQVTSAGSEEQLARAEQLLADARRALYRLLSEDEDDKGASS